MSRVLSVHQPHAAEISDDAKRLENRGQMTRYRGELWIHASKTKERLGDLSPDEISRSESGTMPETRKGAAMTKDKKAGPEPTQKNRGQEPGEAQADLGGGKKGNVKPPITPEMTALMERKFELIDQLEPAINLARGEVKEANKTLENKKDVLKKLVGADDDAHKAIPLIRKGKYTPSKETAPLPGLS